MESLIPKRVLIKFDRATLPQKKSIAFIFHEARGPSLSFGEHGDHLRTFPVADGDDFISVLVSSGLTEQQKAYFKSCGIAWTVTDNVSDVVYFMTSKSPMDLSDNFAKAARDKQGQPVYYTSINHENVITVQGEPTPAQVGILKKSGVRYMIR